MIISRKSAQNLIEFVVVMPLLVVMIFGIIELSVFWRTVHTVQNMALQATTNGASQIVLEDQTSSSLNDLDCTDGSCFNFAVAKAVNVIQRKQGSLGLSGLTFNCTSSDNDGKRPYSLYKCSSNKTVSVDEEEKPVLELIVDYRNPSKNGMVAQLIYQYRTLFLGASISLISGQTITIIPRNIEISSTKIEQYISY